jgi:CRISPR-associated endonuclease/helicase Cas3
VAAERQVLAVVNTTADSAALHRLVESRRPGSPGNCLHLSTRMTARHRRAVLDRVRQLLDDGEPVTLISTQLVEAGVDVDFPVVYRAWAPADSLQQAAGRANRNARLAAGRADPDCLTELDLYYPERYALQDPGQAGTGAEIEKLRGELDFPAVAQKFQLIEDKTISVAVPYPAVGEARDRFEEIVTRLRADGPQAAGDARQLLRDLRPYLATIPKHQARQAQERGWAQPVIGDLLEWTGPYHPVRGIDPAALGA